MSSTIVVFYLQFEFEIELITKHSKHFFFFFFFFFLPTAEVTARFMGKIGLHIPAVEGLSF